MRDLVSGRARPWRRGRLGRRRRDAVVPGRRGLPRRRHPRGAAGRPWQRLRPDARAPRRRRGAGATAARGRRTPGRPAVVDGRRRDPPGRRLGLRRRRRPGLRDRGPGALAAPVAAVPVRRRPLARDVPARPLPGRGRRRRGGVLRRHRRGRQLGVLRQGHEDRPGSRRRRRAAGRGRDRGGVEGRADALVADRVRRRARRPPGGHRAVGQAGRDPRPRPHPDPGRRPTASRSGSSPASPTSPRWPRSSPEPSPIIA